MPGKNKISYVLWSGYELFSLTIYKDFLVCISFILPAYYFLGEKVCQTGNIKLILICNLELGH